MFSINFLLREPVVLNEAQDFSNILYNWRKRCIIWGIKCQSMPPEDLEHCYQHVELPSESLVQFLSFPTWKNLTVWDFDCPDKGGFSEVIVSMGR